MDQDVLLQGTGIVHYQGLIWGKTREVLTQVFAPGPVGGVDSILHPGLLFPLLTAIRSDGAGGWMSRQFGD